MNATSTLEKFIVICAWCDEVLNNENLKDVERGTLCQSHTICKSCLDKVRQEIKSIQIPVVQQKKLLISPL
ncbi:MAG: hypothetical protein IPK14_22975 [Blastocatellia bacterium]|nr:hypothetical protein [Blastocatellia bacterium]